MGIEVAFDNTSHRSMGILGGVIFVLCGMYDEWFKLPVIALWGLIAITVTVGEYFVGRLVNKNYEIWDYRNLPLNIHGQVCLPFTVIWMFIIAPLILYLDTMFKLIW